MTEAITQDVLLAETHHRMMNTLSLMASALRREFAPFRDTEVRDALSRQERMIVAHGALHGCLTVGSPRNTGPFAAYLERLCRALDGALLRPLGHACDVEAEDGFEPACPPERIGHVVAELVTNAAKHAFAAKQTGTIRVTLARVAAGWELAVSDDGHGLGGKGGAARHADGASGGVGAALTATLVRAAGGTIAVRSGPSGTAFTCVFPAERAGAMPARQESPAEFGTTPRQEN